MPSASAGINAVASSLGFEGQRSQVVIGDFEFPTMAQIWLAQESRGATIRRAHAPAAAPDTLPVEAYEAVIDERTLIVPATHVCFRNGHKTDVARLTRIAHDRGAYVFLDDYQRTGSGPIESTSSRSHSTASSSRRTRKPGGASTRIDLASSAMFSLRPCERTT